MTQLAYILITVICGVLIGMSIMRLLERMFK